MQSNRKPSNKRRMTRRQYEAMMRRRRQNRIAAAFLGALALILVVIVALILRQYPAAPKDQVIASNATAVPAATAEPVQQTTADAALTGAVMTAVPSLTDTPAPTAGPEGASQEDFPAMGISSAQRSILDVDFGFTDAPTAEPVLTPSPTPRVRAEGDPLRSVRMRVVGDIMVCDSQLSYAKKMDYDFHDQFMMIADILQNADYTMGNMEGTVGKYKTMGYSGYPNFNCPETILETLKDDGIDFLTLANNHMLDRYFDGMKNTVTWVEQYGFDHVGAYRTQTERDTPVIYDINGIRFGFVAYTHSTNTYERVSDPQGVAIGVPYLYKCDIEADIKKLRDAGAEVVVAWPHWGAEYIREPDSDQTKYARRLAMAGADIILGSHSHMVQPMATYDVPDGNGGTRQVFCIFSLGNFISDHSLQYTDNGVVLDFTVKEHENGSFTVENIGYIPTYTWKQSGGVRVLPSGRYLNSRPKGMDDANYSRLKASYYEICDVLGNYPVLTD